jgi:glycosyltransferase involved in cell wall biosynthesis
LILTEQLGEFGGTERVLAAILDRYPAATLVAPRFDSTNLPDGAEAPFADRSRVLDWGGRRRHFLAPLYSRRLAAEPLGRPDVVLTLAHGGWSLAAAVPPGVRHLTYTAGLPRAFYGHCSDYLRDYPGLVRPALRALVPALRAHHRRLMLRPDRLLTSSLYSAARLAQATGRSAEVMHPPVRTSFFTPAPHPREHVLVVSRLVPHKRVDVAVEAFRGLGERLVVVGGGRDLERLRAGAPANVRFAGYVDDEELRQLYRTSRALVCPSVEEFGIVMAEAHACGVPVVAPRAGGALEIVRDGETGLLLEHADPASLAAAVSRITARPPDPVRCRAAAERFDERRFTAALGAVVDAELAAAGPRAPAREPLVTG